MEFVNADRKKTTQKFTLAHQPKPGKITAVHYNVAQWLESSTITLPFHVNNDRQPLPPPPYLLPEKNPKQKRAAVQSKCLKKGLMCLDKLKGVRK
jgi:hypothetical protein